MPIVDELQSGLRRYAVFTFATDEQTNSKMTSSASSTLMNSQHTTNPNAPPTPATRFPQSPHASSLEASTRLRHTDSVFMKRLKSLEKNVAYPFVDVTFYSSYQPVDDMKRLLEPSDCVNLHDPAIVLQKGCYEEVQLVDPKRDMIQTPIDDDEYDDGLMAENNVKRSKIATSAQHQNPPGIVQSGGVDDYKKTRGYIMIAYKTMEHMYNRDFLSSWKTWTGVRYICMQMPRQLGLRRIAFYRQLSCTSDFSYVLLIEVTSLLVYSAQTLNLMDRIKLRICGYAGVYREIDFQVDPVTANIHHLTTTYKPPDAMSSLQSTLDSKEANYSLAAIRRASRTTGEGPSNSNMEMLTQLLKRQEEAAARRRAANIAAEQGTPPLDNDNLNNNQQPNANRPAKKRHSLAPPDYPAPTPPPAGESSKRAPKALPESEDSELGNDNNGGTTPSGTGKNSNYQKSHLQQSSNMQQHQHQHQQRSPYNNQQHQQRGGPSYNVMPIQNNNNSIYSTDYHRQQQQQPIFPSYEQTPLHGNIRTVSSTPVPSASPYYADVIQPRHQHWSSPQPNYGQLHFRGGGHGGGYGQQQQQQILSHPSAVATFPFDNRQFAKSQQNLIQDHQRQPMKEILTTIGDYSRGATFQKHSSKPAPTSDAQFAQLLATSNQRQQQEFLDYNSPVYTRMEWKRESGAYGGQQSDESMRNLAERFRLLKETPIVDDRHTDQDHDHDHYQYMIQGVGGSPYRQRSRSIATPDFLMSASYTEGDDHNRRVYFRGEKHASLASIMESDHHHHHHQQQQQQQQQHPQIDLGMSPYSSPSRHPYHQYLIDNNYRPRRQKSAPALDASAAVLTALSTVSNKNQESKVYRILPKITVGREPQADREQHQQQQQHMEQKEPQIEKRRHRQKSQREEPPVQQEPEQPRSRHHQEDMDDGRPQQRQQKRDAKSQEKEIQQPEREHRSGQYHQHDMDDDGQHQPRQKKRDTKLQQYQETQQPQQEQRSRQHDRDQDINDGRKEKSRERSHQKRAEPVTTVIEVKMVPMEKQPKTMERDQRDPNEAKRSRRDQLQMKQTDEAIPENERSRARDRIQQQPQQQAAPKRAPESVPETDRRPLTTTATSEPRQRSGEKDTRRRPAEPVGSGANLHTPEVGRRSRSPHPSQQPTKLVVAAMVQQIDEETNRRSRPPPLPPQDTGKETNAEKRPRGQIDQHQLLPISDTKRPKPDGSSVVGSSAGTNTRQSRSRSRDPDEDQQRVSLAKASEIKVTTTANLLTVEPVPSGSASAPTTQPRPKRAHQQQQDTATTPVGPPKSGTAPRPSGKSSNSAAGH